MTQPTKIVVNGTVRWEIRTRIPGGRQIRRRFRTQAEAKAELARVAHEQNQGTYVHPDRKLTVGKLYEQWATAKATDRKPATVRHYESVLAPVLEQYGDLPVADLTSQHLVKLRDGQLSGALRRRGVPGKPMTATSVNAMLGGVHGLLAWAVAQRVVATNVADANLVARVKDHGVDDDDTRRSGWQNEHLAKWRIGSADDRLCGCWALAAVGLRRGEVLGLQWRDIDWEAGTVTIRRTRTRVGKQDVIGSPKSRASRRTLTVGQDVLDALARQQVHQQVEHQNYASAWSNPEGWVAVDVIGRPLRHEWLSDRFEALAAELGLPSIVLHGVRHAAASRMASAGIPAAAMAKWLGQSTLSVTARYVHPQDTDAAAIRAALAS